MYLRKGFDFEFSSLPFVSAPEYPTNDVTAMSSKSLSMIEAVASMPATESVRNSSSSTNSSSTISMLAVNEEMPLGTLSMPLLRTKSWSLLCSFEEKEMLAPSSTSSRSTFDALTSLDCEKLRS